MSTIIPFKIAIPDDKINRLKQKLAFTDFPDEVADADSWSQGPPLSDIKRLACYWKDGFNWRSAESESNEVTQYIADVDVDGYDTYDVHFVHMKSLVKNAIPLLFVHGWPDSFIEVTRILPDLIQGGKDFPAFHVVAPSLIDFGFSSASHKKGFGIDQHAEACHKLMLALGYNEYGGDLGYLIARFLALRYGPEHVKAHHVNFAAPAKPTAIAHPELHAKIQNTPLSDSEEAGLARSQWFHTKGNGYSRLQATKPQTVGYSLTDSPIGLLACIYEKLHDWTDSYLWTDDEILTWISIYYFSKPGPAAASYIYYEMEHSNPPGFVAARDYSNVPLGVSRFPKELILLPRL